MNTISRKQEFKLLKKVLRDNGCLRLYRRKIRCLHRMSLSEHFESVYFLGYWFDMNDFQGVRREVWERIEDEFEETYKEKYGDLNRVPFVTLD